MEEDIEFTVIFALLVYYMLSVVNNSTYNSKASIVLNNDRLLLSTLWSGHFAAVIKYYINLA